jgi:hypothetical protein
MSATPHTVGLGASSIPSHGLGLRQVRRGLVRTAAFVAAFCAIPGLASLFS